jgi:hypothetical protein
MVYSFNWNTQPTGKTAEALATQYIKAKYGTNLADFAKMIIKEQSPPEAISSIGTQLYLNERVIAT